MTRKEDQTETRFGDLNELTEEIERMCANWRGDKESLYDVVVRVCGGTYYMEVRKLPSLKELGDEVEKRYKDTVALRKGKKLAEVE